MLKATAESRLPDSSPNDDSPSGSFLISRPESPEPSGQIRPEFGWSHELGLPRLERRSGYTTMTRMERETYDTARAYEENTLLFVPRMSLHAAQKVADRLSNGYIRPDAIVVLVDGTDAAEIPYREFRKIHPQLFVEVLRYAHARHLLDQPGRLIEMATHLIESSDLP